MKILIIEDERSIANRIERLTREILSEKIKSIEIRSYIEGGLDYLRHHEIDLLLLDLNLNGKDGFEVLRSLAAESFDTIIISAYKDKAIEAFEYGVLDFVPKPFDKDRLEKALNRVTENVGHTKMLVVKKQGRVKAIPTDSIVYIKGANIYSEIHDELEGKELSSKPLDQLERLLPNHFLRIHKSYIVDMRRATDILIQPGSKYDLRLEQDLILPIGRTRYKTVKSIFEAGEFSDRR